MHFFTSRHFAASLPQIKGAVRAQQQRCESGRLRTPGAVDALQQLSLESHMQGSAVMLHSMCVGIAGDVQTLAQAASTHTAKKMRQMCTGAINQSE